MKSDNSFKDFLLSGRGIFSVVILLIVGILLIAAGELEKTDKSASDSEERRLSELCCATEGVGDCRVMITYTEGGEVFAVAVLCDGAGSSEVERDIKELVGSLYGIGANRITVLKLEK